MTLSPIFLPQGPLQFKPLRSSMVSTLPGIENYLHSGRSHSAFFQDLFIKIEKDRGWDNPFINTDPTILIEIIISIYKDYKSAVDTLMQSINLLAQEVAIQQITRSSPDTPTPIPFPLTNTKVSGTTAGPSTQPPTNTKSASPKASCATVVRIGCKKCNTNQVGTTPVQPKPTTTAKLLQQQNGITAREYCLIIKREGSPLNKTKLELRNEINTALASTYVQTISVKGNTIIITTMKSIRATLLNSKVGTFLHLIPGTVSVHLDTPVTQLLVHGLPTSSSWM